MKTFLLAASSLGSLCHAGIAVAGTADAVEADRDVIIVTGEKAQRSLQDTTTSVAVTTPKRIRDENIATIQDVFQRTANVTETYGQSGFTIRGIANRGVTGGEGAALATIFVDGAALPSALSQAAPTDMWDVAQVEILRGPQSTLQGLNALAGAVIVTTTEPTMDWELRARGSYATGDDRQFAAAAGGPIVPGQLAFRFSAEKRDSDGFTHNVTRDAPENPLDSFQLRGKLLWTPTELPGFEVRLGYTHYKRYGGYQFSYTDTTVPDYFDDRLNFSDVPNDSDAHTDIGILDLRYAVGGGVTLNAITTYNQVQELNNFDNDFTAADIGSLRQRNRYKTFSQELRVNYEGERLSGLVGAFFYDRKSGQSFVSDVGISTPIPLIQGLLSQNPQTAPFAAQIAAAYGAALPVIPVRATSESRTRAKTYAFFGDARYKLTDQLSLLAGFRYDHEKNSLAAEQLTSFAGVLPDPAGGFGAFGPINDAVLAIVGQASGASQAVDRTFTAFLPKAGIEMAWTDDLKTAFTVQRGYRSGGSSFNLARTTSVAYDPEYTWNYELSLRSAWLGGALTVNANAFYIDWKDQQTTVNFGLNEYDTNLVNAGKSHLYGFELETAHRVSPAFDWYASVGYTKTKFDEFATTVGSLTDYAGLEFQHAPHWTFSGGVNVRPMDRLSFNLNASHRSAVFTEVFSQQAASRVKSRTLVNARLAYDLEHFSLAVFASNLFDENYVQYRNRVTAPDRAVLGNPRVLGVSLETRW